MLLFTSCSEKKELELPFYTTADFTPHWFSANDPALQHIHKIAPFSFQNQYGEEVNNKTFEHKIYVANFFFTSCSGICPKMTSNFHELQSKFSHDSSVVLLSHSVTPEQDNIDILKKYAEQYEVTKNKWHLVTGKQEEIFNIGRQSYFAEKGLSLKKDKDEFLHTENGLLIDTKGRLRGIYNLTLKTEINRLEEDIKILQAEKA